MIVLLSGGMDSTVLTGYMLNLGTPVEAVSIHYGQRHVRELESAAAVAAYYSIRHDVINLGVLRDYLGGSALTSDNVDVPEGHYSAPSMAATVVPNRNAIMLTVAAGIAVARGHTTVGTAVHAGDHPIYPDCRPSFIHALSLATELGTAGYGDVSIAAPFADRTKTDIARIGAAISAPVHLSWSCYQGGDRHCGRCGTCTERWEAHQDASVDDPTVYADPEFARSAVTAG